MKKRFAIFFMLIHLFMAWEQEAIAVENISIESINLYQVYIRIKEGCTELSKSDLLEMDQYEEAIIYVPDSFSQLMCFITDLMLQILMCLPLTLNYLRMMVVFTQKTEKPFFCSLSVKRLIF